MYALRTYFSLVYAGEFKCFRPCFGVTSNEFDSSTSYSDCSPVSCSLQIQCNVTELDFTRDPLGYLGSLDEWLISLGLPMYIDGLKEVEYDDMELMPYMEERHFQFAGIGDPRHMKRLIESVERMPR